MHKMNTVYLIIGGNKGDRKSNLAEAIRLLANRVGDVLLKSSLYETAAWGNENQPAFYNQVLLLQTVLSPTALLSEILQIEQLLGRIRNEHKWMERTMDIDILYYNDEIINKVNLTIPHPYISERKFVLLPLCEIAANYVHPVLFSTNSQLLTNCTDKLDVKKTV
jgi:2-amino-4-hydroxy-6-hydroxymethyldihydropteridine diphosphokinase